MTTRAHIDELMAALPVGTVARATRLGLTLAPTATPELRRELFSRVTQMARTATGERHTLTAWLGDLLAYGGALRPGQIAACAAAAGLDAGTLRNAKMVCSRIPPSRRHDALSWSHHCEVAIAFSEAAEIERWLATAESEQLATAELRRRIRLHRATSRRAAAASESAPAFRLMRDLRAVARLVHQHRAIWRAWSSPASRLALEELQSLVEFVDALRGAAVEDVVTSPRDPSLN
jgi:hypothetical protein